MSRYLTTYVCKNAGANLERSIQRWSGDLVRSPSVPLNEIRDAALSDIFGGPQQQDPSPAPPAVVQALLRHMMAETVSEGIINCLIVTNSKDANVQLTRIHEHLFAREHLPTRSPPLLSMIFTLAKQAIQR